jgi:hypothetical protein
MGTFMLLTVDCTLLTPPLFSLGVGFIILVTNKGLKNVKTVSESEKFEKIYGEIRF